MKHKSQTRHTTTNIPNPGLNIKGRKFGVFKSLPPQKRNRMLHAILHCKNCRDNNKNDQYVLLYDKPDLCNNYISKEQGSNNQFSVNFPRHCVLGHVLLDVDPLDEMDHGREL